MRNIKDFKFRIYDESDNQMIYRDLSDGGELYDMTNSNDYVMQYTGLKDKEGKEIYEGDIIKDYFGDMLLVEWKEELNSCGCCFEEFDGCGFINVDKLMEVKGNIYENPELLTNKE